MQESLHSGCLLSAQGPGFDLYNRLQIFLIIFIYLFIYFLWVLGIEPDALSMLGKHSTCLLPSLYFLRQGLTKWTRLALNLLSSQPKEALSFQSCLRLLSSSYYRAALVGSIYSSISARDTRRSHCLFPLDKRQ